MFDPSEPEENKPEVFLDLDSRFGFTQEMLEIPSYEIIQNEIRIKPNLQEIYEQEKYYKLTDPFA